MKKIAAFLLTFLCSPLSTQSAQPQSTYDEGRPFGFATVASRTDASITHEVTGGGAMSYPIDETASASVITLTSTGEPMDAAILAAIKGYDIIVFDGAEGDFILSRYIKLSNMRDKTLLGINGARLCTEWYVTDEVRSLLDAKNVASASTSSGTGGTLSNGTKIDEQAEYLTRTTLLARFGNENYRLAGILQLSNCSNFIIRNLRFVGPGSIDVGGYDLLSFTGTTHCWVDHCDFTDGIDGNFDITNSSDFITVSWCTFSYTNRSYMHQNTNLVGSSDSRTADTGKLNITFAYNIWGEKCRARMPMARYGKIHMLNNYFNCTGNGSPCINPRKNSEFLIEGNYFSSGVTKVFAQSGSTAYVWTNTNYIANSTVSKPASKGTCSVPYPYTLIPTAEVPRELNAHAGATLTFSSTSGINSASVGHSSSFFDTNDATAYNLHGRRLPQGAQGLMVRQGRVILVK